MKSITAAMAGALLLAVACAPATPSPAPPTVGPTAAPAPTVAAPPPPTVAPTALPVPTLVPPTSAPAVASACDNPFYPVSPSARWQYRVTGTIPSSFAETRVNIGPSSFTSRMVFDDLTVDNEWRCTAEGLLASQTNRLTTGQGQMRFDALRSSGVTIPRESAWTPNHRWLNGFEIRTSELPGIQGTAEGKITIENVLTGEESIMVPAGSYRAMRVNQNTRLELTVAMGGMTMPMTLSFSGTSWFARGVGLVKHEVTGEIGDGTTELVSFAP